MRFTWLGLLVAPLLVPVLAAALLSSQGASSPVSAFLILLAIGWVMSFGTTVGVFLPCLFLLSRLRPMTMATVCLLGFALGAAVLVPLTWMAWLSSGPDSGPPAESFLAFVPHWIADPFSVVCPVAGLVTAWIYWGLGTWRGDAGAR